MNTRIGKKYPSMKTWADCSTKRGLICFHSRLRLWMTYTQSGSRLRPRDSQKYIKLKLSFLNTTLWNTWERSEDFRRTALIYQNGQIFVRKIIFAERLKSQRRRMYLILLKIWRSWRLEVSRNSRCLKESLLQINWRLS